MAQIQIGRLLREARKAKKLTQEQVAEKLGVTKAAVSQWESDTTRPDRDRSRAIARLYGLALDVVLPDAGDTSAAELSGPSDVLQSIDDKTRLPHHEDMPRDVPLYGTMPIGDVGETGDFLMTGEVVDRMRRPPGIANNKGAFGLRVLGETMIPWRRPREPIYIDKTAEPMAGDHVYVELHAAPGETMKPAYLKKLSRISDKSVRLEQYNPPKVFDVPRKKIASIARVKEYAELLEV